MQEKEREEIIKMFMERFEKVDLRLVFSKPFGGHETPLEKVFAFMEAVRRGDAGLKSALTEKSESLFDDLSTSIDAIKKDRHQMFAIAYQAVALLEGENAMSKEAYREQIEAPFKRIFGQSPDEVIGTKEEPLVLSPADFLAIFNAQKNSVETKLHVFDLRLRIFDRVIAARTAAGQDGAGAAAAAWDDLLLTVQGPPVHLAADQTGAAASSGGTSSSSSSSSSSSAGPAAAASAAGSSPSDDETSPSVLAFKKEKYITKVFYRGDYAATLSCHSRAVASVALRTLLYYLSKKSIPEEEQEEAVKMFMERFEKVDLRLVFSKPFSSNRVDIITVLSFMEGVRCGEKDGDLKAALEKKLGSSFGRLSTSIDAIKKDPHQMFAIACQARFQKDDIGDAYREQIEEPFKSIFGQSPDEIIDTPDRSPAAILAVWEAQQRSLQYIFGEFKRHLSDFEAVIADRSAAGKAGAGAAAASAAISGGASSSSSGSSSSSAGPAAGPAAWDDLLLTVQDSGPSVHSAADQTGAAAAAWRGLLLDRGSRAHLSADQTGAGLFAPAAAGAIALMPSGDDVVHFAATTTEDNASTGSYLSGLFEDELPGL